MEGVWGSGKSTIINIVKRLLKENNTEEMIVIDDFDPWIFNDESTMLVKMFDIILSKTSIKPSYFSISMFLSDFRDVIFDSKIGKGSRFLGSVKVQGF